MIELTITPRYWITRTQKTWWFVEWPEGGKVSPAKEMSLLDIVYDEMKYSGTVGFCVQYPVDENNYQSNAGYRLAKEANYHVMFVDEIHYLSQPNDYVQRRDYEHIVGMVFKDKESAELFKYRIEVRWTFKALQADY